VTEHPNSRIYDIISLINLIKIMQEDLNSIPADNTQPKSTEAPLTEEELAALKKEYTVDGGTTEETEASQSENGVTELNPNPGNGERRVMIDGVSYEVATNADDGKIVELLPYSLDESGNINYGEPVRNEKLFAKVDPEIAKNLAEKMNIFTAENYNSLDAESKEELLTNFFSGSESEIQDRILKAYNDDTSSSFSKKIFTKVGYGKGQFQVGQGWN
jgi:hypothetical protein